MTTPAKVLADKIASFDKRLKNLERAPRLANASIEGQPLPVFDGDQVLRQTIGLQDDGTYTVVDVNGPPPPVPSAPTLESRSGALVVTWDGAFAAGTTPPADWDHVEVHVSTTSGYTPTDATQVATFNTLKGGSVTLALDPVAQYVVLQAVNTSRIESAPTVEVSGTPAFVTPESDGVAPATSPDPLALSGIGFAIIKWEPIVNADPVTYEVHVSTALGFTATPGNLATLVGVTPASQLTVRQLPGVAPAPGDPDPRVLDPDATYYARVIAVDADGAAPQSAQMPFAVFRVTGIDLQVDSVTADHIVLGTLTGELFSANVIVSGVFKTADAGQRVEFGIAGIKGYKADGTLMVSFPTAAGEEALFDGEMIARGMTVLGGASLYGDSELNADSTFVLQKGITQPSSTPQVGSTYDYVQPSTASLSTAQKTGSLGTFDFIAAEISCIEWRSTLNCFSMYQSRPNGTREWYISTAGLPVDITGGGVYWGDWNDWDIRSATEMLASGTPAKNGHYLFFRFIPSGTDYYCFAANGNLYRYSRQNGATSPVMGNNGTDVYVAEIISSTHLNIRYFNLTGVGANFPAPTTVYESSQGFVAANQIACCTYGTYDVGSRYLYAIQGSGIGAKLLVTSGSGANTIFPGGSSNNWASANAEAESFEAPTGNRRCTAHDGTQFWSLHGDGFLYKHTNEHWDPAVSSSNYWAAQTFYDSVGTTHETLPGTAKNYAAKRRSKNFFTPPTIPAGGVDDPDNVRLYMARGASLPANSSFHLQYTGAAATSFTTLATVTASPPTSNNFPLATAAKITNGDGHLIIDGAANIVADSFKRGADNLAIEGPYWYGYLAANVSHTSGTNTLITTWTADGSSEITYSAGVITVGRAGRYRVLAVLDFDASSTTGGRLCQVFSGATSGAALITGGATGNALRGVNSIALKTIPLAAGAQFRVIGFQDSGGAVNVLGSAGKNLSYFQVEWVGP